MDKQYDLTQGSITPRLLRFTLPMMMGSLLQQCYNIADTLIVGRYIGAGALAAVGSAYTLMTFLTSVLLGLAMGSGTVFSLQYGAGRLDQLGRSVATAFILIGTITVALNVAVFAFIDPIMRLLRVPADIYGDMRDYLWIIFCGLFFSFVYNFYAALLRAVGDAVTPLKFLAVSVILNIGLDLLCVLHLGWGVEGAAVATVAAQAVAAAGLAAYAWQHRPELRLHRADLRQNRACLREIATFSSLTCVQQSVMNFGILLVQGLVNSFGTTVMAAFAAAVKIDSFAYMPVQEFGNAFSTFVAQNHGAGRHDRVRRGLRSALAVTVAFSLLVSVAVFFLARQLMLIFVLPGETEILAAGVEYLRIEGAFYVGIGILFLLYGYYRAVRQPGMSVVLTVLSLGTRVGLSYWLAALPAVGATGIWWSIPIGWALADVAGFAWMRHCRHRAPSLSGRHAAAPGAPRAQRY